jgi:hypothetical protein
MKVSLNTLCKILSERKVNEAGDAYLNVEASRRGRFACCEMFGSNSTAASTALERLARLPMSRD